MDKWMNGLTDGSASKNERDEKEQKETEKQVCSNKHASKGRDKDYFKNFTIFQKMFLIVSGQCTV